MVDLIQLGISESDRLKLIEVLEGRWEADKEKLSADVRVRSPSKVSLVYVPRRNEWTILYDYGPYYYHDSEDHNKLASFSLTTDEYMKNAYSKSCWWMEVGL